MAGGVRFGADFVKKQVSKRKKWIKGGVRAGHGGSFSLAFAETSISSGGISESYFDGVISAPQLDRLPDWLTEIIKNDVEIKKALAIKGYYPESPHKKALVKLAKDPSLYLGIKEGGNIIKKANKEHYIQVALFYKLESSYPTIYPYCKSVPNGGIRPVKTAIDLNAEGLKDGSLDFDIDYPKGAYHGMRVEVKTETGTASRQQKLNVDRLNKVNYYSIIGKGFDICWNQIAIYLELPEFDNMTVIADNI